MARHNSTRRRLIFIFAFIILLAGVMIFLRMQTQWALASETKVNAVPAVVVVKAAKGPASEDVTLPGNVQAWHEAPIYARTSGYLKSWKTDIGTRIKEGDLIAEIDTPEIDAQLRQAEADLKTAEAGSQLAQSTATRWRELLKTDSVSKQEADEKIGDAQSKLAALASARAGRDRLRELASFRHVVAPFDGTITARNTDTGALINTGSGVGPELFHIADISKLRIYVQVPQTYAGHIKPDMLAELHFAEHPGKTYSAKLEHSADAIDPVSRTLLAQFVADNADGELLAGGYTEVHLKIDAEEDSVHLPVNTLIFRAAGLQVATIDKDNHVVLKPIVMGRDYGNDVEVKSGIEADEAVIVNPPDSLATGEEVRIVQPKEEKPKEEKK